jgi:acyl carrier protein
MYDEIKSLLAETLGLGPRAAALTRDSALLGSLPEFDSMAVVSLVNAIEARYGVVFDDDELSADSFATLASLTTLVERKLQQ